MVACLRLIVKRCLSFIWFAVVFRSDSSSTEKVNDSLRTSSSIEDSDLDVEESMPAIESLLPKDVLRKMKPKEKKLQEVVNGKYDQYISSAASSHSEKCGFSWVLNPLGSLSKKSLD